MSKRATVTTMEVESTRVHVLADGKKMIDVTMRRAGGGVSAKEQEQRLVVPQFDDESSSSSDDDDERGDSPPLQQYAPQQQPYRPRLDKSFIQDHSARDDDALEPQQFALDDADRDDVDNNGTPSAQASTAFRGEFQWSGVADIQALTLANAKLQEHARELQAQVKTLQIQLEALAPVPGMDAAAVQDMLLDKDGSRHDIRDVKIVHQAKSLRHLKRTAQREKQLAVDAVRQCKLMEAEKAQLEKENETLTLKLARFQARASAAAATATSADDGVELQPQAAGDASASSASSKESAGALRKRFEDLRIRHDKLQTELKRTQRALQREVGEDVPLEDVLENANGNDAAKRGRAQQIIMLKAKVKKLEHDLERRASVGAESSQAAPATSANNSSDVDQRAHQDIATQHVQRQRVIDRLTSERDELQERVLAVSKKLDALKSRAQTLEKEKQDAKAKVQMLVDKSRNDDALVDALQRQLETWKGKLQEAKRARTADNGASGNGSSLPKDERLELDRLRAMVADYKRQQQQQQQHASAAGGSGANSGLMPAPSEASQFRALAAEKERLADQVRSLQSQLDDKEKQLRASQQQQQPALVDQASMSRIPRLLPGAKAFGTQYVPTPPVPDGGAMEAMRRSFRDSMASKEQEIEVLKQQLQQTQQRADNAATVGSNDPSELQELQDENQYLRQEFDRLKARYETLVKSTRSAKPLQ